MASGANADNLPPPQQAIRGVPPPTGSIGLPEVTATRALDGGTPPPPHRGLSLQMASHDLSVAAGQWPPPGGGGVGQRTTTGASSLPPQQIPLNQWDGAGGGGVATPRGKAVGPNSAQEWNALVFSSSRYGEMRSVGGAMNLSNAGGDGVCEFRVRRLEMERRNPGTSPLHRRPPNSMEERSPVRSTPPLAPPLANGPPPHPSPAIARRRPPR